MNKLNINLSLTLNLFSEKDILLFFFEKKNCHEKLANISIQNEVKIRKKFQINRQ